MLCWLLGKRNTPKFIIIADKYLYLRVEKFTTLMTILAPDGFIGSSLGFYITLQVYVVWVNFTRILGYENLISPRTVDID